jgi:hypothetical protein
VTHASPTEDAERRTAELLSVWGCVASSRGLPHEFSGGQKQRVMIAMALACEPKLVIADEPTTALDVMCRRRCCSCSPTCSATGLSILFITHDLSVLAQVATVNGGDVAGPSSRLAGGVRLRRSAASVLQACRLLPTSDVDDLQSPWLDGDPRSAEPPPGAPSTRGARGPSPMQRDRSLAGGVRPIASRRASRRTGTGGLDRSDDMSEARRRRPRRIGPSKGGALGGRPHVRFASRTGLFSKKDASPARAVDGWICRSVERDPGVGGRVRLRQDQARSIMGFTTPDQAGSCSRAAAGKRLKEYRRRVQMVYQDPTGS